jgi:Plavaka transposase
MFCQTELPKDGKPLCITLYADKTHLSSFGTAQGYPIMAQINNLPHNVQNSTGLGSTQVVGWLPIVSVSMT